MKVIYEWGSEDIQVGRYVICESSLAGSKNLSFAASVTYKIGFLSYEGSGKKYCMVSISDGMITEPETKDNLAAHFNEHGYKYRPVTQKELEAIIGYLESQNIGKL